MRRSTLIIIIFVIAAAVVVGASQFLRSQPPLDVTVAVSPLIEGWAKQAADSFNATEPVVNSTRRVRLAIQVVDDLSVWSDDAQTRWTTETHPAAWIPAASASVSYADRYPLQVSSPSLAKTLLAWGGFRTYMSLLTADNPTASLTWAQVAAAVTAESWSNLPGGESLSGYVVLAFNRPNRSMAGLAVLLSGAADFFSTPSVSGSQINANDFRNWIAPVLQSVPNYNTLGRSAAETMASRGESVGQIALLPESEWLANLRGQLTASGGLLISYPDYPFVFDFPMVVWTGDSGDDSAAMRAAADLFRSWLLAPSQQNALAAYGLRDADGSAGIGSGSLFQSGQNYGIVSAPTLSDPVEMPARSEVQRLLSWVGTVVR